MSDVEQVSTQKWSPKAEAQMNQQIKAELEAAYAYQAIAQHFDRHTVNLKNIAKYFYDAAKEEREHAQSFIDYQNKRGGTCQFFPIQPYNIPATGFTAKMAFEKALKLEKTVYDILLKTHDSAPTDPQLQDMIASEYLPEQVKAIDELSGYIANLTLVGEGIGVYLFDKEFRG